MPDTVGSEQHKPTSLWAIANKAKADKHHRFRDLYRCLNAELLLDCWRGLNKDAASGVDGETAQSYAENLQANIAGLVERLKSKRYRAKLVRRHYIPKENGKKRPLGIPAVEDKLVQAACAYGYLAEADVKGFFDHLDHDKLLAMLSLRIDDRAFLGLIRKWLKAGILEPDAHVVHPDTGTPQGGIVSPVLANAYLHYVLDLWFEKVVKPRCDGEALLCRYADDWVCAFRYREDAERFYRVLPKRLKKFNLEVAPEKTKLLRFSRFHPSMTRRVTFLGFEFFWKEDRKGTPRVMRRTSRTKLQAACRRVKEWIKLNRHLLARDFFKGLNLRLRGHYNYYGVRGNSHSLYRFFDWAKGCAFKWLNRRGGKRPSFTWDRFTQVLALVQIARPRITEISRRRVMA